MSDLNGLLLYTIMPYIYTLSLTKLKEEFKLSIFDLCLQGHTSDINRLFLYTIMPNIYTLSLTKTERGVQVKYI